MENKEKFIQEISASYTFKGNSIILGASVLNGIPNEHNLVKAPLQTFNRHGLIAGATGTGKTKSLQMITEKLSLNGVPTLVMDIKGDLSGISQPGTLNPKIEDRIKIIGEDWKPRQCPAELLSISDEPGVKLKATISEFGPVLLTKMLELNDTQGGVVSLVFKYADDKKLPLLDIKDFRKTLQFLSNEGKKETEKEYGLISTSSVGAILRNLIALEEQGADAFFGEPSFDVDDLMRLDENGYGYINILRLTDIQGKPKLFSTFMLCLLAEIYEGLPEKGDIEQPELVIFIDEAHLIFNEASKALLSQIETIIKLIRSKGVGIFFITQSPDDIPESVLAQLGMKIQHALRAFTAKDRKAIKIAAENYPLSDYYKTEDIITQLGIGEALVTVLNEKGIPTSLVHCLMCPPTTRMDIITETEQQNLVSKSKIADKYNKTMDRESAHEMLTAKLEELDLAEQKAQAQAEENTPTPAGRREKTVFESVAESSVTRTVVREVTRGLLGMLGIGGTRRRTTRKTGGWF
ncbi:MAG: helicase HerA-like domain-containing protein [Bacteroidia bacterium]